LLIFIGLHRNDEGQYRWTNGEIAQVYEGYWFPGQPVPFHSGTFTVAQYLQYCYINIMCHND